MVSLDFSSKFSQINLNMRELSERTVYEFENFRLDADNLLLFHDGEQLAPTPKVVATLLALVERRGEIVTKNQLMEILWPDTQVEEGNLTQNLYILRKTLGTRVSNKPFIETLRGRGYRFSAEVSLVPNGFAKAESISQVLVSRKENIYSVVDWQRAVDTEEDAEQAPIAASAARAKWIFPALAAFGLVSVVGLVALFVFRPPAAPRASMSEKRELTFLQLTDGRDVNDATISPDGSYLTYHESDGGTYRMWLQQVGESNRVEVIPPTTKVILSKTFAPNGKTIFFIAAEGPNEPSSLYSVPALGGVPTKIAEDLGSTVAVSPDGRQIAFIREDKSLTRSLIIVADIDGTNQRTILTSTEGSVIWGGLAWSPDARFIAFGQVNLRTPTKGGNCAIAAFDLDTGTTRELSGEKWDTCGRMAWTFDNKELLFIGTKRGEVLSTRRDQLFSLTLESGEVRRLTTDGNRHQVSSLGVTYDNAVLVVPFNRSSQLWVMDASGDSSTVRQITSGLADGRAGIAPLPDGRIGYIARVGDSLNAWTINADGSEARQITKKPDQIEELRAATSGTRFYFSSLVDGMPRLFESKVDGSDLRQVLADESFDVDSTVSPDGNWVVYNSAVADNGIVKKTLRIASIESGEYRELTSFYSLAPHFSPDGQYISFIGQNDTIGIISVSDGTPVANFKPLQVPLLNVGARWTPDGKAIAYIVRQKSAGNIWRQPIDRSTPERLTDFSSGEIYNFAFSADGRKIILARGYPIKNAVLLKAQ